MSICYVPVILVVWTIITSSVLCQLNASSPNNLKKNSAILNETQACKKESTVIDKTVIKYENEDYLKHSLLAYGLLVSTPKDNVSNTCYAHATQIIEGIKVKKSWALKVLDASGNVESGFILGNNHWLGSKKICESINTPYTISMSKRFKRNTIPDLLEAKSPISVQYRMVYARHASPWQIDMKFLEEHILHIGLCLPITCSNSDVHNMVQTYFLSSFVVPQLNELEISPHVMQVKDMKLRQGFYLKWSVLFIGLLTLLSIGLACLAYFIENTETKQEEIKQKSSLSDKKLTQISTNQRLILYFSVKRNLSWLYDTKNPPQSIGIIFGLKLAPLYFIVILAVESFTSHIVDTSLFFMHDRFDLNCQRYWWRNILFIQNFFPINELCVSWSWSLACEMQYFVIFLSVLFIYAKNEKLGLKIFFTFASVMFAFILCKTITLKFVPSLDVMWATANQLYTNMFARMSPYFPGIAGGWFYSNHKGQSPISMRNLRRTTILASILIFLAVHGTVIRDNFWLSSIVNAVGRWAYASSVVSLILANTFGCHNMLTRSLSAKVFVHISKLEYGIYLLNPLVVMILCGFSDTSQFVHPVIIVTLLIVVSAMTYVLAVLFKVLFELPFSKLIDEFFTKKR